ncbi:DUF885 domain-containing protein [Luteimonas sp. SJ-92]|uniref:DUF885 domain-containing protein n=1 Tax=Luteimonas salinisoli TaxID=2752307 RepID=A0A853JER0_9GAMM|nr:DUF885 domain-containing protein [Luteimonas salinisoli]NZA26988.1 DUF885 domain-containing protein [Luteimonas salinisoli]
MPNPLLKTLTLGLALLAGSPAIAAEDSLHAVMDAQFQRAVAADPEAASMLGSGDAASNSRLTDISLARRDALRAELRASLDEIEQWDRDRLEGQERWSHDFVRWFYDRQIQLLAFDWAPAWLQLSAGVYAVDHLFGMATMLPRFMDNSHAVADEAGARQYIARLQASGAKLDQLIENFDMQAAHGVVPPRVALEGAASQVRELLRPPPEDSVFVGSLARRLDALEDVDPLLRGRLLDAAAEAVRESTNPGYARLLARIEAVLEDQPHSHGLWALPQGDAYYDAALRWYTSTDLDAEQVHDIGLEEVARIEKEMEAILHGQGLEEGTLTERLDALAEDPAHRFENSQAGRDALLAEVREILDRAEPGFPALFGRIPTQPLEVRPVPEYAQDASPGGYYFAPAPDGSRPGTYFINLGTMDMPRWTLPTQTYHEGAPGHHFQIALSQTLDELPALRRNLNPSAFTEGWALYAEQLMAEQGAYRDDPLGDLGRLQQEMFRAVRLVLDTGLHRKRWTPERAIAYLRGKTGMSQADARTEVYRYLVQPGQASSYKIGHLKMVELRERARQRLGDDFDLRAFHDLVLGNGALPLSVVEGVVDEWIAEQGG